PAAAQMGRSYSPPPATPQMTTPGSMAQPPQPAANGQPQPAAPGTKPIHLSSKAQKAIIDLQTAVNKNDVANIPAKLAAARAVAATPDDRYAIGELQLKASLAAKDDPGMFAAVDAIATSGFVDAATSAKLYKSLGGQFYNAKQYDQAIAAFQKATTVDPRDTEAYTLMGEAKFAQGQKVEAATDFQRAIQLDVASGQHPDEEGTLDLLRLMQVTGAMTSPHDYALFAEAAADQSNFNEAQAMLDAGQAAHLVDPSSPEFRDIFAGLKSKPKA